MLIPPSRHPRTLAGRRNGTTGLSRFGLWPSTIQIETLLLIDLLSVNIEMSDPPFLLEGDGLIPIWMAIFGFGPAPLHAASALMSAARGNTDFARPELFRV